MDYQTTLLVIKPDCIKDKHVGEVLHRFERKGFDLVDLRMINMRKSQAAHLYQVHKDKPFFDVLCEFMATGSCIVVKLGRWNAVEVARALIGADGQLPGTIRGDFATTVRANVVHASDSIEAAVRELQLFFDCD